MATTYFSLYVLEIGSSLGLKVGRHVARRAGRWTRIPKTKRHGLERRSLGVAPTCWRGSDGDGLAMQREGGAPRQRKQATVMMRLYAMRLKEVEHKQAPASCQHQRLSDGTVAGSTTTGACRYDGTTQRSRRVLLKASEGQGRARDTLVRR